MKNSIIEKSCYEVLPIVKIIDENWGKLESLLTFIHSFSEKLSFSMTNNVII